MKKSYLLSLVAIMIFVLLSGCNGEEKANGSNGNGGKTTIQFWHSLDGKNGEYMDALIQRFNDSQDEVKVVGTFQGSYDEAATKLQQSISANTGPDVTMLERAYVQQFAESDVLEDMSSYLKSSGLKKSDFAKGLMGHSTFNEKLVSLPLNRSTPILHVNKTILDEKGLKVPTNWEELKKVANALVVKEGGKVNRYGFTMPYDTWYPIAMISQSKGTFFNKDKTSIGFEKNDVGVKVFEYLKDMQKTGALYYPPSQDSGNIVNQMFTTGKVPMMFQSTGTIGDISQNAKFDYVTAFLPKNDVYATPTGGGNVAMLASSKNKEAAWKFIDFMMEDPDGLLQFILDTGYLPFTKKMAESKEIQDLWAKEPNRKTAYDQLKYAVDNNKSVAWPQTMHEFFSAIEAIMYDDAKIEPTLKTFKKETERILSEN
ncbi:ABC transporter substrate-binding protein [Fictibacillus terranigra]|uniref:ABC transporter substrate-binding protein n=1 Tax=Fictibacillus terranigra TaxID=3058424 RepID=A0ABT8E8V9_9BACL|nr:ABC transporter substrate-binding protein [Fictibacillus sp. CENA-BCM004]MDN4074353.1 ABC transporter substrate-binding protein [Fictibacillus sp. CENA-BCM004]